MSDVESNVDVPQFNVTEPAGARPPGSKFVGV
jgi:hypothetical protein